MGAFRFSDSERNVIIASTDLPGLSKVPLAYESGGNTLRGRSIRKATRTLKAKRPHYSISNEGERLWGTHDVYADDIVEDEIITLVVSHTQTPNVG
jgi:hypothetical protein